ncbi:MAG TPA: MFS transporter [Thermodesulfobacteriota bacterium]|nr:MFS transporter [Thermodesulfobacteriota bacterium]
MPKILTRDFVLCFFAQFTFTSVFHTLIPTLPIYLLRLGSTEVEIGVLIGTLGVSSLVLRPFVGRALLRIPERRFMIAGALLFALTSIAYLGASSFWPFLMVRVFQGIGMAFFYTASVTLIANMSPEAHRGQSISYFFLAFNISFALAPSLGMFLINVFSFTPLFLLCLSLSLCSLFLTTRLGKRQVEPSVDHSHQGEPFLSREALSPAIMAFFAHVIWGALTTFFPLYALNQGVTNPGFFFAAYATVLILGRALGGKILDLYSREKVILPCLTSYIISMTILSFSNTLPMFILVAIIWGIGNAFLMPSLVAYVLDRVGSSRGPALGTFTAMGDLGTGLGPVIMGIILRWTSYSTMFLCLALTGMINLVYFYFFVRKKGGSSGY